MKVDLEKLRGTGRTSRMVKAAVIHAVETGRAFILVPTENAERWVLDLIYQMVGASVKVRRWRNDRIVDLGAFGDHQNVQITITRVWAGNYNRPTVFADHTVLEMKHGDLFDQWIEDSYPEET